jgi:phosphatidylglycerophosphate synthase
MVTIIGLLILCMGVVIILPFDSTMTQPLPSWAYVLFAVFLFGGQTFDAIDGKHARNTNRSSPLGQLMDHGCDAFSNSFIIIMIAQAHMLGGSIHLIIVQIVVQLSFFVIQWEEHHTGCLLTHINNMGVTEFQFIGMALCMFPVFLGKGISKINIISNITFPELFIYLNTVL